MSSNNSLRVNWNPLNQTYDIGIEPGYSGVVGSVFGRTGVITAHTGDYNVSQITGAAPLDSPGFIGTPTVPNAASGTNTQQIASTAFVQQELGNLNLVSSWGQLTGDIADQTDLVDYIANNSPGTTNASLLTSGTLDDARLSANVAFKNADNNFSTDQTFGQNLIVTGTITNTALTSDLIGRVKITTIAGLQAETSTSATARYYVSDAGKEGIFYYDSTDTTTTDDGVMTLVSGTRRYKRIVQDGVINVLWWGADNTGTNDTAAAQNAMFTWVQNNPMKTSTILFPKGTYRVDSTVELPHKINTTTESIQIEILGFGARLYSTVNGITIWSRMPADQTDALNVLISNWIGHIRGFVFDGLSTAIGVTNGQTGLKLGALYSWTVEDCNFNKLDTGIQIEFGLSCRFINLRMSLCNVDSFVGRYGTWTGATNSNSAFNANTIENCRAFNKSGGVNSALNLIAGNGNYVRNYISEGSKPTNHVIIESNASSVVKQNILDNIWIESNGGTVTTSTIFRIRNVGTTYIKNVHMDYPDILFDSTNSIGSSNIVFDGIHYTSNLPTPCFNTGSASQTLGYNISFHNIGSGALFFNKLYDPTSWVNGVVPFEIFYDYENGEKVLSSSTYITLKPGQSLATKEARLYGKLRIFGGAVRQYRHEFDSTNYFEIETGWTGTTNFYNTGSTGSWGFITNGATRLFMDSNNAVFGLGLLPSTDNSRDLGRTSGPLRWKTGYFATSLGIGTSTTPVSFIDVAASTTTKPHLLLTAGASVISPTDGMLWYNGTNLYFRSGGVSTDLLAGGGGDMTKAVYDSDGDGVIDADALPEFILSTTYFGGDGSALNPVVPLLSTTPTDGDGLPITSNAVFDSLSAKASLSSPQFTNQIGVGTAATSAARIALPTGTTAADGILFGDIAVYRQTANNLLVNSTRLDLASGGTFRTSGGLSNTTSSANAYVSVPSLGTQISRDVADANHALIVNLANAGSTGRVLDLQFQGSSVASINRFGGIVATNLGHATGNNGMITLNSTGISVTRNVADSNTALIVNQQHASSTGNIVEFLKSGTAKALIDVNGKLVLMDHTTNSGGIQFGNTSPFYLYRSSGGGLTISTLAGTGTRMVVADASGVVSTQAIPGGGSGDMTKAIYDSNDDGIIDTTALPDFTLDATYFDGDGSALTPITPSATLRQISDSTPSAGHMLHYTGTVWESASPDDIKTDLSLSSVDNMSFNDINSTAATITGTKTFGAAGDTGKLKIAGSTSGAITLEAPAVAGTGTVTLPSSGTLATQTEAKNETLILAVSDETTALTAGTAKLTFRMPFAMTLSAVRASLTTTSSSGTPTVDINETGTTILSTKLTIDVGEKTSTTAAVAAVISDSALADDAEITIDIDVAGTGATGLKVYLIGTRA